ncbi:MAG: flagellar motor switch protein FliN [Desulfuromonadales bacterium]|nr:flagellar motor switch protein FliN [Desulfuromonadales bacterium]
MNDTNLENGEAADAADSKNKFDERGIDLLLDIPLEVAVEVGRSRILVRDLLQLQEGSLVELDKLAGEPLDLYVNSRLIARGEAVVVNDKFGLRLTDVVSPSERIENLG